MSDIERHLWIATYAATIAQIVLGGEYEASRSPETHDSWARVAADKAIAAFRAGTGISVAL